MATFSKHHLTDTFLYHLPIMSASFTHHIIRTHISKLAFVFFDQCKVILIHKKSTESFKGQHPRASMLTPWLMSLQHATNIFHFMIQAVAAFSYESHMFDTTYMTITTWNNNQYIMTCHHHFLSSFHSCIIPWPPSSSISTTTRYCDPYWKASHPTWLKNW